jgi:uncharacterized protein (TIGR02145 family)
VAAAILSIISCNKDEDTTTAPSLEGSLKIEGAKTFIGADKTSRTITLKPSGGVHPEGKTLGYYWKVSPVMTSYDTTRYENGLNKKGEESDGTFTYEIKDSLGTYTIYCYAYASGYTGLSTYAYTTVVRGGVQPEGSDIEVSITNTGVADSCTPIEGTDYYYTTIGNYDWTANNMADKTLNDTPMGVSFINYDVMSDVYGRYYSYNEAKQLCANLPSDGNPWRLPTDKDWVNLVKDITTDAKGDFTADEHQDIYWDNKTNGTPSLGARLIADGYFNDEKLWDFWPEMGEPENTSRMSVIPVGYANLGVYTDVPLKSNYPTALFEGTYEFATFWTSDEVEDNDGVKGNSPQAYYRYIFTKTPHLMIGKGYKDTYGASVRCVRNSN